MLNDQCDSLVRPQIHLEQTLLWNDPVLNIEWPVNALPNGPKLSDKDKAANVLKEVQLF
jgi:dTDP-4-dehydrorhamnose 3,5-epimerase-like enzyme